MTREVLIRAATLADVEAIRAIYAPMVTDTTMSFEESPPDAPEIIRRMLASPRRPWLVADVRDHVAGYAYASAHRQRPAYRWSADSSVYVDPHYQGQGLGRLLYERLINEVRDLGYVSLFAGIALPNDASVTLHEAMGFRTVGVFRDVGYKQGCWRDVGWWHKTLASPANASWRPSGVATRPVRAMRPVRPAASTRTTTTATETTMPRPTRPRPTREVGRACQLTWLRWAQGVLISTQRAVWALHRAIRSPLSRSLTTGETR